MLTLLDVNRDRDPEFTLGRGGDEIPYAYKAAEEAKRDYKKLHFLVDELEAILTISEKDPTKEFPVTFHDQLWPKYGDFIPWFRMEEYDTGPYTPYYCSIHKHPEFAHFIDIVYSILRSEYIRCAVRFTQRVRRDFTPMGKFPDVCTLYDRYVYIPAWLFWNHNPHLAQPVTAHDMLKRGYDKWFLENDMPSTIGEFPWILDVHCKGFSPHKTSGFANIRRMFPQLYFHREELARSLHC